MKIKNLKNLFKINYGLRFYLKHNGRGLLIIPRICSWITKRRLRIKRSSFVNFDYLNPVSQCTHPDIIRSNINGLKYVLTVSGYPYNIAKYENPYIFSSRDGINFFNGIGKGAVVEYQGDGSSHYSDSEIIEENGEIYLFYRMCYEDCQDQHITLFVRSSSNLLEWSDEVEIVSNSGRVYLSPSIVKCDNMFFMYFVDCLDTVSGVYALKRLIAKDVLFAGVIRTETLELINAPAGLKIWHIDVIEDDNTFRGLFTFMSGEVAERTRLYYAESRDGGKTWRVGKEIVFDINMKIVKRIYRSSMIKTESGLWDIYYAVCTYNNCWFLLVSKDHDFTEMI